MTTKESKRIERRHEVAIRIGADSWQDVLWALHHLEFIFSSEGPGHDLTSGGYSFSIIALDKTNEDVTHDSYFQEVEAWLDERRKEKEMQKETNLEFVEVEPDL